MVFGFESLQWFTQSGPLYFDPAFIADEFLKSTILSC